MKNIILLLVLISFSTNLFAKNYNSKLSFNTHLFLKMCENTRNTKNISKQNDYFLSTKNGIEFTKIYIKVDTNYSQTILENIGCKELVKTKTIALISAPVNQIENISAFDFIELIEIAVKPKPFLDKALPATNVDKVHIGVDLEQSYFGEGVIVGVVDWGFDFTHPMFVDSNGNSRIKRAWLSADMTGTPPDGSQYGTLYTDSNKIQDIVKYSSRKMYHGSHVLGISAGSKVEGEKGTYSGIATGADIAVVELGGANDGSSYGNSGLDINEALAYLFSYADSAGKPIVVNMSLGSSGGPGDGKTLRDIQLSEILNVNLQGHILVAAAGNNGASNMHFQHQFTDSSYSINMTQLLSYNSYYGLKYTSFHIWGEEGNKFAVSIMSPNGYGNILNLTTNDTLIDTMCDDNYEEKYYYIIAQASKKYSGNNKPYITITIYDYTESIFDIPVDTTKNEYISFLVSSINDALPANVHCWNAMGQALIMDTQYLPNSYYTIGSPGTIEEVITIGAYVSRNEFTSYKTGQTYLNLSGEKNRIAYFSSIGPLTDGYIKPDITAPGSQIYSALNSFDTTTSLSLLKTYYVTDKVGNHEIFTAQGTSMSAPIVTGIVALMLEINPKLTQSEIKDILRITAINDEFTGDAKNNKSPVWGWGKIDAHAIMKHLEFTDIKTEQDFIFNIFPNPIADIVNIKVENLDTNPYVINVFDELGKLVYLSSMQTEKHIDLSKLSTGTYFIKLYNGKMESIQKFLKK